MNEDQQRNRSDNGPNNLAVFAAHGTERQKCKRNLERFRCVASASGPPGTKLPQDTARAVLITKCDCPAGTRDRRPAGSSSARNKPAPPGGRPPAIAMADGPSIPSMSPDHPTASRSRPGACNSGQRHVDRENVHTSKRNAAPVGASACPCLARLRNRTRRWLALALVRRRIATRQLVSTV